MGGAVGRRRSIAAILIGFALAAGCSSAAQPAAPRTPAPVGDTWPGCEAVGAFAEPHGGGGPQRLGGIPTGFGATRAVLCEAGQRTNAHGDTVAVDLERTATEIGPLLTYLAQPDERPTNGACPAIAVLPPWLFLLDDAGRYVAPAIPRDECGLPIGWSDPPSVWASLSYTDRVLREREVTESAEAQESGCSMQVKDVVVPYAAEPQARSRALGRPYGPTPLRVCVYDVPVDERAAETPIGSFVRGRTVAGAEQSAVVDALAATTPGPKQCTRQATRFAVVEPAQDGSGPAVWVELDGCRRALDESTGHGIAQAGDDLVGLLAR